MPHLSSGSSGTFVRLLEKRLVELHYRLAGRSDGRYDFRTADAVVAFVVRQDDLGSAEQAVAAARADRLAWIGYPKGGHLGTDLNRDRLVAALAGHGVQPVRQISIDDTWSGLRFVYRVVDREH